MESFEIDTVKNIDVRVVERRSGKRGPIAREVENALYLTIERRFAGRRLRQEIKASSDIFLDGLYERKGSLIYLDLTLRQRIGKKEQVLTTSVVFDRIVIPEKRPVIILDMEADFLDREERKRFSTVFRSALIRQNVFESTGFADIVAVSQAEIRKKTGCSGDDCALIVGRQLGVDRVVRTKLFKQGFSNFLLTGKIIDVRNGTVHISSTIRHQGRLSFLDLALKRMAAHLAAGEKDTGNLSITSTPKGAKIILDGKILGQRTDALLEKIPIGKHELKVYKSDVYRSQKLILIAGDTRKLHFDLMPFQVDSLAYVETTGDPLNTRFKIVFNGWVDPGTVTSQTVFLERKGASIVFETRIFERQVMVVPKEPLRLGTRYRVLVTRGVRDLSGNKLLHDFERRFKTPPYPGEDDPNILIYSQSHGPVSYTKRRKGTIKIGITSFNPIRHIDINGKSLRIPDKTLVEQELPFTLPGKRIRFLISVITDEGKAQKKFVVHYGSKPKPKIPPFRLIAILKATKMDNLNSSPANVEKIGADKTAITLVPMYRISLGENSSLNLKGVLLREKFAQKDYQDKETSYTQLAAAFKKKKTFLGTFNCEVGANNVKSNNQDMLQGENDLKTEVSVSAGLEAKLGEKSTIKLDLKLKNQDSKIEVTDEDDNADAKMLTFKTRFKFGFFGIKNTLKAKYGINDAVGKYKDYAVANIDFKQAVSLGKWTPSWQYSMNQTDSGIVDPRLSVAGIKTKNTLGTLTLKLSYKLFSKTKIALEYKNKKQASNVEAYNFESSAASFSATQQF
ncbi:MAG: PEGA domain-containing protein [Proteobacteria bacterium]|nr:PEGA domain-containing protein [Pseudomonadota bacterium]